MLSSQSIHSSNGLYNTHFFEALKHRLIKREIEITHTSNHLFLTNKSTFKTSNKKFWISFRFVSVSASLFATMTFSEFATTTSEFASMTSKAHALFCSILYIFAFNIKRWTYYIQRYESKWHQEMKNNSQCEPITQSIQFVFFAIVCSVVNAANILSNEPFCSEFAVNQDAPINKDSKSSNPRSLRQHTLAKSISLCCFCFCFCFRFVLRHRPFRYTNLQISSRTRFSTRFSCSQLSHIFFVFAFAFFASHLSFHVYRICFGAFSVNHGQTDIWVIVGDFFRNADRSKEKDSRFETKFEEEKEIVLRACLKIWVVILSYQREFIWELARSRAWRSQSTSGIRSSVHICSLNQISSLCYLLSSRHAPYTTITTDFEFTAERSMRIWVSMTQTFSISWTIRFEMFVDH